MAYFASLNMYMMWKEFFDWSGWPLEQLRFRVISGSVLSGAMFERLAQELTCWHSCRWITPQRRPQQEKEYKALVVSDSSNLGVSMMKLTPDRFSNQWNFLICPVWSAIYLFVDSVVCFLSSCRLFRPQILPIPGSLIFLHFSLPLHLHKHW